MTKLLISVSALFVLTGCSSASASTAASASSSSDETPTASAQVSIPADAETVDCVVEQDLPLTLKATIQDLTVLFIKADDYTADAELNIGDEITVTYTGDLSGNPTAYQAVKK